MNTNVIKISTGIFFLCLSFVFIINTDTVFSAGMMKPFGIEVKKLKAKPIEEKEKEGYTCIVPGQSIEGRLVGSPQGTPTSYFIPAGLAAKGGGSPKTKKQMLGFYSGVKTQIVCIRPPADVAIVNLDTVAQQWSVPQR